jgi:hypothetical protein
MRFKVMAPVTPMTTLTSEIYVYADVTGIDSVAVSPTVTRVPLFVEVIELPAGTLNSSKVGKEESAPYEGKLIV